jgi:hypothetical protein
MKRQIQLWWLTLAGKYMHFLDNVDPRWALEARQSLKKPSRQGLKASAAVAFESRFSEKPFQGLS